MTIFPTPFFGRSPFAQFTPRYLAFAKDYVRSNPYEWNPRFRVSKDGKKWAPGRLRGNIVDALVSNGPLGMAFKPVKVIRFKGRIILVGSLTGTADSAYFTRAGLYVGEDGYKFNRVDLPNGGLSQTASHIVDVAANDNWVAALGANGVLYYWNGVDDWQARTDLPVGASPATNRHMKSIAASANGFVCAGAYSNADGSAGSPVLVSAAAPNVAFTARALPSTNALSVVTKGNIMVTGVSSDFTGTKPRILYSPLNDLANWTSAGFVSTQEISTLLYNGVKWIGGVGYNKSFIASVAGTGGWTAIADPAKTPWGNVPQDHPLINGGIIDGATFLIHWGHYTESDSGGISLSDDGETWQRISAKAAGLEPVPYMIGLAA